MRAVVVPEPGGPEQMTIDEVPPPTPGPDEVLVQVHATALNRADTFQRQGHYPPPEGASDILGLEMAGTVVEAGDAVVDWEEDDRVFALLDGGGYAEYTVVHKDRLMAVPPGLSMQEAAAVPEVFLHRQAGRHGHEPVLVHDGVLGVTPAVQ